MKKSKKAISLFLVITTLFSFFFAPLTTFAAIQYYGRVLAEDGLNVRQGPGTSYKLLGEAAYNTQVKLVSGSPVSTNGCSGGWYQIYYNNSTDAYVCGTHIAKTAQGTNTGTATTDYEKELKNLGFPSTYWDYLTELHKQHPNWTFEAVQTNIDWSDAIAHESIVGVSLIQTDHDGWKSLDSGSYNPNTGKFIVLEGSNWYAASSGVVAYYMDPRNFLDEKYIFMFEKLSFDSSYQTITAVKNVFNGGNLGEYATQIYNAGKDNKVNPIYLASRIKQEVGSNVGDSKATTGAAFTYDGKSYSNLYNVYNIGATTGTNPVLRGLVWANGGSDGSATSYNRPWNSIEKSIAGGAQMIASSYINKGQNTTYFQKFDVAPTSQTRYSHQYMTNIKAVASESLSTYNSYASLGLLNTSYKFAIPVFKNMPASTTLPSTKLDTSKLPKPDPNPGSGSDSGSSSSGSTTTVQPNKVISSSGYKTDGSTISGVKVGTKVSSFVSSLKSHGGTVTTKASGTLGTGDQFTINNKTYTVIIYGDLNNDGNISLADLVQLKKHFLDYNNLNATYKKAADVNKDGKLTLADLVQLKKKMIGLSDISQ